MQGVSLGMPLPFLCRACIGSRHKKYRGTSPGSWRSLYSRVPISLYHETDVRSKWERRARLVRTLKVDSAGLADGTHELISVRNGTVSTLEVAVD